MENRLPLWRVAANILNKESQTAENSGPPAWWLGEVLTTSPKKKYFVTKYSHWNPPTWIGTSVRPKQLKGDMSFDTSNVRSLHGAGLIAAADKEWERYKLDLVGVWGLVIQKSTVRIGDYNFFFVAKKMKNVSFEQDFGTPQNSISQLRE